jgi:hypothetical protein
MLKHSRLLEVLHYDPLSGVFTWRVRRGGSAIIGSVAGGLNSDGYLQIKIDRVLYKAHRLAWFYVKGVMPGVDVEIDHRNRIRTDNKFSNLREADESETACNRSIRSDNSSGVPGVNWNVEFGKWRVRIQKNGKRVLIGDFADFDEAVTAREIAVNAWHGKFAGELRA